MLKCLSIGWNHNCATGTITVPLWIYDMPLCKIKAVELIKFVLFSEMFQLIPVMKR